MYPWMSVVTHLNSLTLLPTPGPLIRLPGPVLPGNKAKRWVGDAPMNLSRASGKHALTLLPTPERMLVVLPALKGPRSSSSPVSHTIAMQMPWWHIAMHKVCSCTFMSILQQQKANLLPPHCFAPAGQPRSLWVWGETSFLSPKAPAIHSICKFRKSGLSQQVCS